MAIPTSTAQLAVMEWGQVWEPGLPLSPVAITTEAQQQLVWGYPWGVVVPTPGPAPLPPLAYDDGWVGQDEIIRHTWALDGSARPSPLARTRALGLAGATGVDLDVAGAQAVARRYVLGAVTAETVGGFADEDLVAVCLALTEES